MKGFLFLLLAIVFIFACKPSTLEEVRGKWGPPAEVNEWGCRT